MSTTGRGILNGDLLPLVAEGLGAEGAEGAEGPSRGLLQPDSRKLVSHVSLSQFCVVCSSLELTHGLCVFLSSCPRESQGLGHSSPCACACSPWPGKRPGPMITCFAGGNTERHR